MSISHADVQHIANLARLALSDDELARMQVDLAAILDYMTQLNTLDTADIPPTASVLPLRSVMRDDVVAGELDRDALLANTSAREDGCFVVPAVIDTDN